MADDDESVTLVAVGNERFNAGAKLQDDDSDPDAPIAAINMNVHLLCDACDGCYRGSSAQWDKLPKQK